MDLSKIKIISGEESEFIPVPPPASKCPKPELPSPIKPIPVPPPASTINLVIKVLESIDKSEQVIDNYNEVVESLKNIENDIDNINSTIGQIEQVLTDIDNSIPV